MRVVGPDYCSIEMLSGSGRDSQLVRTPSRGPTVNSPGQTQFGSPVSWLIDGPSAMPLA